MGRRQLTANVTESLIERGRGSGRRKAFLFLVLESQRPCAGSARWAFDTLDEVHIGRGSERTATRSASDGVSSLSVTVPDSRMSSAHLRLVRLGANWIMQDADSKNGTYVNDLRVDRHSLAAGDVIESGGTFWCYLEESDNHREEDAGDLTSPPSVALPGSLVPSLARELDRLAAVSRTDVPVLLRGDSGTGKELIARRVHSDSARAGRFVAVNCGALAPAIVESELFGHRKGAFSGATEDRPGWVRSADGGTLLLDEIGDLPLAAQAALLRVLQEREVVPVGSTQPVRVDVRVIAATHRDLDAMVREGRFRADLLARLRGFTFRLPPLAARRAELGHIVRALLERLGGERAPRLELSIDAARALIRHDWPLNVRELEQALGAALPLASGDRIELEHLPAPLQKLSGHRRPKPPPALSEQDLALKQRISALLEEHGGSVSAVAHALGKDRKQIRRWIARFGLRA